MGDRGRGLELLPLKRSRAGLNQRGRRGGSDAGEDKRPASVLDSPPRKRARTDKTHRLKPIQWSRLPLEDIFRRYGPNTPMVNLCTQWTQGIGGIPSLQFLAAARWSQTQAIANQGIVRVPDTVPDTMCTLIRMTTPSRHRVLMNPCVVVDTRYTTDRPGRAVFVWAVSRFVRSITSRRSWRMTTIRDPQRLLIDSVSTFPGGDYAPYSVAPRRGVLAPSMPLYTIMGSPHSVCARQIAKGRLPPCGSLGGPMAQPLLDLIWQLRQCSRATRSVGALLMRTVDPSSADPHDRLGIDLTQFDNSALRTTMRFDGALLWLLLCGHIWITIPPQQRRRRRAIVGDKLVVQYKKTQGQVSTPMVHNVAHTQIIIVMAHMLRRPEHIGNHWLLNAIDATDDSESSRNGYVRRKVLHHELCPAVDPLVIDALLWVASEYTDLLRHRAVDDSFGLYDWDGDDIFGVGAAFRGDSD